MRLRYAALSDVGRVRTRQPGLRVRRTAPARRSPTASAGRPAATSPAAPPSRCCAGSTRRPATTCSARSPARSTAATTGSPSWSRENPEIEGTSTTVTAAIFDGTRIGVGHVGDSRGYLLRDGTLSQLTTDHTFVQSLIDEGRITEDEARVHPHRNLILRAVDGVHEPEPDVFTLEVAPGDRILLCSDGCSGRAHRRRAGAASSARAPPDHAAVALVRASLDAGSSDNVTVVVADVVDDDAVDDAETTAAAVTGPMRRRRRRRGAAPAPRAAARPAPRSRHRRARAGAETRRRTTVDPEELRYAPRAAAPVHLGCAGSSCSAVLVLLVAIVAVAGYKWTQNQYYVANDGDDVAIFRGVAGRRARHPACTTSRRPAT